MRLLKKDEYTKKVSEIKSKKKKYLEKANKRAFRYFVRKINKVNTCKEPRQLWFWLKGRFDLVPSDFLPCVIKLENAFDYLDFDANLRFSDYGDDCILYAIKLEVKLKH